MAHTRVIAGVLIGALAAAPVVASADQQRRRGDDRRGEAQQEGRAVPRSRDGGQDGRRQDEGQRQREAERDQRQAQAQRQGDGQRQAQAQRQGDAQRQYQAQRQGDAQRQYQAQRQVEAQRQYQAQRQYDARQYDRQRAYQAPRYNDDRRYDNRGYDNNRYIGRAVPRPYYSYSNRGYGARTVIIPRIVRPSIVTVIPYRPYVYRPSIGLGVYYGTGGAYPYGYTPRGYYDPYPGRPYGGLRIVDAPRDAQVFADGYYIGLVDDFDGVFQHANLEAGAHRIEIVPPGYEPIAFDVMIQPDRTITYRADMYPY